MRTILVATDGAESGDRALSFALALARRQKADLTVCYAVDFAADLAECTTASGGIGVAIPVMTALDGAAAAILQRAAQRALDAGTVLTTRVLTGPAVRAICDYVRSAEVDAIVMGTRAERGLRRAFVGSVADGVLRFADVPVFVVPPGDGTDFGFERMLVALDDSSASEAAVGFALALAETGSTRVTFCGVAEIEDLLEGTTAYAYDPTPMIAELRTLAGSVLIAPAERARHGNVACECVVATGDAAEQIVATATAQHADFIVLGTHGRRGLRRLFLGSVAEDVIVHSRIPVAVVRALPAGVISKQPAVR